MVHLPAIKNDTHRQQEKHYWRCKVSTKANNKKTSNKHTTGRKLRNIDSRTDKGKHNLSMKNTVKSFRQVQGTNMDLKATGLSLLKDRS